MDTLHSEVIHIGSRGAHGFYTLEGRRNDEATWRKSVHACQMNNKGKLTNRMPVAEFGQEAPEMLEKDGGVHVAREPDYGSENDIGDHRYVT